MKGETATPKIGGAKVDLTGQMFELLSALYNRSDTDCNVAISFNQSAAGAQQNPCRDLVVAYKAGPTLVRGEKIARRLASVTTHRSGLGLLFLVSGMEGLHHKIIISRFPADSGILAEQSGGGLSISFLERIFMKSAKSYKAVVFKDASLSAGFWHGHAVDKQINSANAEASNYWIADFLDSDFLTTSAAGTRRLAHALRDAAKEAANLTVKSEIISAATLAVGLKGQKLSIAEFATRLGLSEEAKKAIFAQVKPAALDETFQLNGEEFAKQLTYKSIELDNGGMRTAETEKFDEVFKKKQFGERARFSTEGRIVNEKVGKGKVR